MDPRRAPNAVAGIDAIAIGAGDNHTCAVRRSGMVSCWGENRFMQVGMGGIGNQLNPVDVVTPADFIDVEGGARHTCARRMGAGSVWCWGENIFGQLGDGVTPETRAEPAVVSGVPGSDALAIAAGDFHSCALSGSTVSCWGDNGSGQLGDGTTDLHTTPTSVVGLTDVSQIAAGAAHTCAVYTDGLLSCWGRNAAAKLGDGSGRDQHVPTAVMMLGDDVVEVAAGDSHTCARLASRGELWCWGGNLSGQLGNDSSGAGEPFPVRVVAPVTEVP